MSTCSECCSDNVSGPLGHRSGCRLASPEALAQYQADYAARVRQEIATGTGVVPGALSKQDLQDLGSQIYNFVFQLLDTREAISGDEAASFAGFCESEFKMRFGK